MRGGAAHVGGDLGGVAERSLVEVVVDAGAVIVPGPDFGESLDRSLRALGEAAGDAYLAVARLRGRSGASIVGEWNAGAAPSDRCIAGPVASGGAEVAPVSDMAAVSGARWTEALGRSHVVDRWRRDFEAGRPAVEGERLYVPVFSDDDWWGVLVAEAETPWTPEKIACHRLLASAIGRVAARTAAQHAVCESGLREVAKELKAANQELIRARDDALEASRAKGRFLANMSHEIRTPLNGVIGLTNLLLERPLDPESMEMVRAVQSSGETLLRVIDDILDFSKIEAGILTIEPTPLNVAALVADVVSLYQGQAHAKGIRLSLNAHDIEPTMVTADPVRLRQILSNLVSNAVKFTEEGWAEVRWSRRESGETVVLEFQVVDTGVGIPADRIEAVFGRFIQADNSVHRQFGGSGLGLSICRHLVEMMGGSLSVRSKEGRGSEFTVRLEFARATVVEELAEVRAVDLTQLAGLGLKVLLAEDNGVNVMVARRLLHRCGCSVDVVEDGLKAADRAASGDYDLILMDMQMPRCDGLQATVAIREQEGKMGRRRPIVALTANAMADDRRACFEAGMDDFLAKPITMGALAEVLDRWSGHSK